MGPYDDLRGRWYMGWACTGKVPLQQQLRVAVQHFHKRHGRLPAVVAVRERDGATAPTGVELVERPWVQAGHIYLYP